MTTTVDPQKQQQAKQYARLKRRLWLVDTLFGALYALAWIAFLNGSPVDNIDETFIENGMTLALSSSMPGLAGATLRRGGMLSSMRRSITYPDKNRCPGEMREGFIAIKLFNILGEEIGPVFVRHGIRIEAVKMAGFISLSPDKARLASIMGKDKARDPEALVHMLEAFDAGMIEITIQH